MYKKKIFIGTIGNVKMFCDIASSFKYDIDVQQGRYTVDAKSIMGLFSLDLLHCVDLVVRTENEDEAKEVFDSLKSFMIE